jgi:hypothetical protein
MTIIEEYDESLFIQRFENYNRVVTDKNPNGNFTYQGLRALFEYLDEISDEENPIKLDVIAVCCDYCEYQNLEQYWGDYSNNHEAKTEEETEEEFKMRIEEEINENTTLIKLSENLGEGFIIGTY